MVEVEINPNLFAYAVLCLWPVVAIFLYVTRPVASATIWTILGGFMLLPVQAGIKFPVLPLLDKTNIPNLCALVGCILVRVAKSRSASMSGAATILVAANLIAPLLSVFQNNSPVAIGARVLPAADFYNGGAAVVGVFFYLIPFIVGLKVFSHNDEIKIALKAFVLAGLIYSLPAFYELRFSPQLHAMLYGYYPSQFTQSLRGGGYRPMVFMGHGLTLTFFMAVATLAAATLWRLRIRIHSVSSSVLTAFLGGILLVSKSLGAALYCLSLAPLILRASQRFQILAAFALVSFALTYPLLRSQDLVPTSLLIEAGNFVSSDRALSLRVRFDNEDRLLAHASQRLMFGWGGFGRNRIYGDEYGDDRTLTDGRWIITMGNYGLLGFLAEFGLLGIGVFGAVKAYRYARSLEDRVLLASLSLIVAINIIDLLPNSTLTPWTWLLAGALYGKTRVLRAAAAGRSIVNVERNAIFGEYAPTKAGSL